MHNEWITFLQGQQANIDDKGQLRFAPASEEARAASEGAIIADLSPLGVIRVDGEDASTFLQGQFSNDIQQLDAHTAQISSYCNPKGRILACFWIYRHDDSFYMLLPADTLAATLKRLRMYVLMSRVTLEDVSNEIVCIGLAGNEPGQVIQQQLGGLPSGTDNIIRHNDVTSIRLPGARPRYLLIGPNKDMQALWQTLNKDRTAVGYPAWQLLDIEAGLPSVYVENVEAFVPQMLNLHAIGGVSFKKGCYPGQEIVARMHYLGKLKRRMYRAHVDTATSPLVGDEVFSVENDSGQGAGRIVMASPSAQDGFDILVVVPVKVADQAEVHLQSVDGPKLNFIELPYEVPLEREA